MARAIGSRGGGSPETRPRITHFKFGLRLLNQTYYNNIGLDAQKQKL